MTRISGSARYLLLLLFFPLYHSLYAQSEPQLYVAVLEAKNFVVGAANAPTGLHRFEADTVWTHQGWKNARNFGFTASPEGTLFLANGNGAFRSTDQGETWKITSGWEVTEVQDVTVDPSASNNVYLATAYGVWYSADGGDSWIQSNNGIPSPQSSFTSTILVDRTQSGRMFVGSEGGLYVSHTAAPVWTPVGPRDVAVRDLAQSPADPNLWVAGTAERGVLISKDNGANWTFAQGPISSATCYAVALDPEDPLRMAAGGFQTGVFFSNDGGQQWTQATRGLPNIDIHALAFDANNPTRLWAGTIGSGVYYTDDQGRTWTYAGLDGATIYDMDFLVGL